MPPNSTAIMDLAHLRARGTGAVAELFQKYRHRLERMVALRLDHRLQCRLDPSDVLQEGYLEAARRIGEFLDRPDVSFFVWLRQLTWQALVAQHRRHLSQKRDPRRETSAEARLPNSNTTLILAQQIACTQTTPSRLVMRAERDEILRDAIEALAETDREVILLRHFEQLSNAEAAEVLGLSPTAASNRYVRALNRLKEALNAGTDLANLSFR